MTVRDTVLQKIAKKCELKLSEKNQFSPECLSELEDLLQEVYATRQPKPSDYEDRVELIRLLNDVSKEIYGDANYPPVEEYGSFVMDIFSADSDLDVSISLTKHQAEVSREMMVRTLTKFANKFHVLQSRGYFRNIQRVFNARVPIIKAIHCDSGIECDISVENRDAIKKSRIIKIISTIDVRFQRLSFLMKAWAKAHQINSAKTKTLNSMSIISLVAFHLQTRDPPILPPFSAIFTDGTDPATVMKIAHAYADYGKHNKEQTADLFVSLLVKLASVKQYWSKGLCASTFFGSWILKVWADEFGYFSVEDFSMRSENVARAVNKEQLNKIYDCITNSLNHLAGYKTGQIQKSELRELLFGLDPIIPTKIKIAEERKGLKRRTEAQTLRASRKRKRRAERKKAAEESSLSASDNLIVHARPLKSVPVLDIPMNMADRVPLAPTPYLLPYAGYSAQVLSTMHHTITLAGQEAAVPLRRPVPINSQHFQFLGPQLPPVSPLNLPQLRPHRSSDLYYSPYQWNGPHI